MGRPRKLIGSDEGWTSFSNFAGLLLLLIVGLWLCIELPFNNLIPGLILLSLPLSALIGLILWFTARNSLNVFNASYLQLDPDPPSIGGHFGGHIDLHPSNERHKVVEAWVSLSCYENYIPTTGRYVSIQELWSSSTPIHITANSSGPTRLTFCMDITTDAPLPRIKSSREQIVWHVHLNLRLKNGQTLKRRYSPVTPALEAQESSTEVREAHLSRSKSLENYYNKSIERLLNLRPTSFGVTLHQYLLDWILSLPIFGVSLVAGYLAYYFNEPVLKFTLASLSVIAGLASLYLLGNSLQVELEPAALTTRRKLFGLTFFKNKVSPLDIKHILILRTDAQVQKRFAAKANAYYLKVHTKFSNQQIIARNLINHDQAKIARAKIIEVCQIKHL